MTIQERDYVLGTHDAELTRLGLQHQVWRPRALAAWEDAGFGAGQTLLDVGSGPGYATLDLAEMAGPRGRVVAFERSRRFLDALAANAERRQLWNITPIEADLDVDPLPELRADGAWVRWVFAFVQRPRELLRKIRQAMKPGGRLVVHEYFDYSTWRLSPRSELFEEFVAAVMASWRATGGEPDVGLDLPRWLGEEGFAVDRLHPIVHVISPSDFMWQWPRSFIGTGIERLVELGRFSVERKLALERLFAESQSSPSTIMITPAVMEIIATAR